MGKTPCNVCLKDYNKSKLYQLCETCCGTQGWTCRSCIREHTVQIAKTNKIKINCNVLTNLRKINAFKCFICKGRINIPSKILEQYNKSFHEKISIIIDDAFINFINLCSILATYFINIIINLKKEYFRTLLLYLPVVINYNIAKYFYPEYEKTFCITTFVFSNMILYATTSHDKFLNNKIVWFINNSYTLLTIFNITIISYIIGNLIIIANEINITYIASSIMIFIISVQLIYNLIQYVFKFIEYTYDKFDIDSNIVEFLNKRKRY